MQIKNIVFGANSYAFQPQVSVVRFLSCAHPTDLQVSYRGHGCAIAIPLRQRCRRENGLGIRIDMAPLSFSVPVQGRERPTSGSRRPEKLPSSAYARRARRTHTYARLEYRSAADSTTFTRVKFNWEQIQVEWKCAMRQLLISPLSVGVFQINVDKK